MDVRRFDDLARLAANGDYSRRSLLRLFTGTALVTVPVQLFGEARAIEAAACRQRSEPCRRNRQCCAGGRCRRGKCRCRPAGAPCTTFKGCCSQSCDSLVGGGTCSPCRGRFCNVDRDCCGRLSCTKNHCGGCRDRGASCSSNENCCFSDCGSIGACLSDLGGPCARDVDCRGCYLDKNCAGACVDGTCTV